MIPPSVIAEAARRPDRLCNLHFFNPALVVDAVEVIPNAKTSPETMDALIPFSRRIGKHPLRLVPEIPGFIANRLMTAIQDEAMALHVEGVATIADIDAAARPALRHPMGPFELMDMVGLDVIELMHRAPFALTGDDRDLPPSR